MASDLDVFSGSRATKDIADANVDVATADQAIADGKTNAANQIAAINANNGRRQTGGGQFGPVGGGRRGPIQISAFGGLANADRTASSLVKKGANTTTMNVERRAQVQHDNPGLTAANAEAALSPGGFIQPVGVGNLRQKIQYDDSGTRTVTNLP